MNKCDHLLSADHFFYEHFENYKITHSHNKSHKSLLHKFNKLQDHDIIVHIVFFLRLLCPMFSVSLDCPILIAL